MMRREGIIIVKREQIMAEFLGHSKDLITLSLSLSLSLSQVLTYNSLYIIKLRGHPRQDTAFPASMQEKPMCFYTLCRTIGSNDATTT